MLDKRSQKKIITSLKKKVVETMIVNHLHIFVDIVFVRLEFFNASTVYCVDVTATHFTEPSFHYVQFSL